MLARPVVAAGFVAYVACFRKAVILWRLDERVFEHPHRFVAPRNPQLPRLIAIVVLAAAAAPALAQQTIFNVPSADVLDKGKTYLEARRVWAGRRIPTSRSSRCAASTASAANIEAGVNFGGFRRPRPLGPDRDPQHQVAALAQRQAGVHHGRVRALLSARLEDGDPAVLWYGEGSYKLTANTRLTAGGYWASSGYAASDPQAGALLGFEQKINDHLNLIADWFSGENALGYFTPGVSVPLGAWTIYAGLLDQERRLEGQRGPGRARLHLLRRTRCWT